MDVLKPVLILGALFLAYNWAKNNGLLSSLMGGTTTPPAPTPTTQPPANTTPPIDQTLAAQLIAAMNTSVGRSTGTVSEWNWEYRNAVKNDPNAPILEGGTAAEQTANYGVTQLITVDQYLVLRQQAGLSGIGWFNGAMVRRPLSRYVH